MAKKKAQPPLEKVNVSFRSAKTGKFVTESYAKKHPNTTVKHTQIKSGGTDHTGPRKK